jgi:hypothetical protein
MLGLRCLAVVAGLAAYADAAQAHGIAGNRYFPRTLTFDDPAVADELVVGYSGLKHPAEDAGLVSEDAVPITFMRLLTPDIAFGIDAGVSVRNRSGFPQQAGLETIDLSLKALLYKNEPHEMLLSAAVAWGVDGTGDVGVGGGKPDIFRPGLFFGKGFGDLPEDFAWFRPVGITLAVTAELPTRDTTSIVGVDTASKHFGRMTARLPDTVHWGFALKYSTFYLTDRFTGGPPKHEPPNQWVPLVEFAFDSPVLA